MQLFYMHMFLQIYSHEEWDFWLFQYKTNREVCLSDLSFYLNNTDGSELFLLSKIWILKLDKVQI